MSQTKNNEAENPLEKSADQAKQVTQEFWDKLISDDLWIEIGLASIKIILILLLTAVVLKVGRTVIRNIFRVRSRSPFKITERREATLSKLLENVLTYVVYFIAITMVLTNLGVEIGALLAGAGIVGLAVGFGAQNLVRDIITGFFIIFEDQFSVGDFIRVGALEGNVEEIGLRTTKIKNWTGELHIIPNGNIAEVTNFSIHNSIAVVDVSIAYEENIEKAERVISELLQTMPQKYEELVTPPDLLGVQTLGASDVVMRIVAECTPMQHWAMARNIRKDVKLVLDKHGIEIPFPRMVMYNRQEEESIENSVRQLDSE
ncbi:mechanosensitive ion channel family protein [Rossellomorea vietnamensis]|uniref:Mechanosensitive ion channel family protein n=1 Tax=Rossellomorea vietnamensis TaxID=218284 RepID=A0A5D4NWJ0_9BACI|nr:mechanosensitive ion channel family protein [Rossellomorea vietnamensis]TYS18081.1 mechanosensitive ion channel family protein [Rossellomorea vietnamensis]